MADIANLVAELSKLTVLEAADLAKALLSLPAVTAFEYGAGFAVASAERRTSRIAIAASASTHSEIGRAHV